MKLAGLALIGACWLPAASPLFEQSGFTGPQPAGWHQWAPRPENAAQLDVDENNSVGEPGALRTAGGNNPAVLGGWERVVGGVTAGKWYRLTVDYRGRDLDFERRQVVVRLDWQDGQGRRAGQPEYAYQTEAAGSWTRIGVDAPAPEKAGSVAIQLLLWDAPRGVVWWDRVRLEEVPAPSPRMVKIASINLQPHHTGSAAESVSRFLDAIERNVKGDTDLIVLPEGITVVGTGKKYADVAESIPGPTTKRLGQAARAHDAYVVAGIYEREGAAIYNTAVLLDRSGALIGKYRKVYIPREETEGGISPGASYPVFETDFGKLGLMICWDVQYADPARGLALGGAEVIAMPIWGGNTVLAKARAIENHLFLVTSGYNHPTNIIDPDGEVLALATEEGTAAIASVDLNKRYVDPWLGNMRGRYMRELRLDVPVEPPSK